MAKVAVYGNLIYDNILKLNSQLKLGESNKCDRYYNAGGIANFCRAARFSKYNKLFDIAAISSVGDDNYGRILKTDMRQLCDTDIIGCDDHPTTAATVLVDKVASLRTGIVSWGACANRKWTPINADWHHIMYLDRINITEDDLAKFVKTGKPISADICGNANIELSGKLKYIDYLIISAPDLCSAYFDQIKKAVITHSPTICVSYIKNSSFYSYSPTIESDLNVLGAGDYFAAHCVANLLDPMAKNSIDLDWIHSGTIDLLHRQSDDTKYTLANRWIC